MGLFDKFKSVLGSSSKKLDVEGRFERLRSAVSGTMSNFQVVRDIDQNRIVGLKLLDIEKYNTFEARFKGLKKPSEGEIAMKMKHPNIVQTFEYGTTTKGQPYLIMEYIEGPGLQQLIQNAEEERLAGLRLPLVKQMASALLYVHENGFIHRDICPRNFIVLEDLATVKLIDFGLTVPAESAFMQPGNRTGTPLYMAPEVVRRKQTDQRVDVFSFGVTLYCFYTFQFPWPVTETTGRAALKHDTSPPRDILEYRPQLNPTLAKAIMKCIQPDPQQRMPSMSSFVQAIKTVQADYSA